MGGDRLRRRGELESLDSGALLVTSRRLQGPLEDAIVPRSLTDKVSLPKDSLVENPIEFGKDVGQTSRIWLYVRPCEGCGMPH